MSSSRAASLVALLLAFGGPPSDGCFPGPRGEEAPPPDAGASPSATASTDARAAAATSAVTSASTPAMTADQPFRVGTFNAGLARGWLAACSERRAPIHRALREADLDLVCLQEYWSADDYAALVRDTGAVFRHQHRAAVRHRGGACSTEAFGALARCATSECTLTAGAPLAQCVSRACREPALRAGPACLQCLVSNTLAETPLRRCLDGSEAAMREEIPAGGLAMLARLPLADLAYERLDAPLLDRLVLYAHLPETPIGEVHAFCTHLTTPLALGIPGMSPEVNQKQVEVLLSYVAEKTRSKPGVTILLGDLNTGPALGDHIAGYQASHYALLPKAGFANPFADGPHPSCTRCNANALIGGDGPGGVLIDHVLVRNHPGGAAAKRMFDAPDAVPLLEALPPKPPPGPAGAGGSSSRSYPLSDHYGVRVDLTR